MTDKEVKVQKYLLKNPLATVTQIHKATKVSKSYAHKIRGKISTPREVIEREMNKITRSTVLDNAKEYVTKDRASTHGDMEDNFSTIAEYWSVHLGVEVNAVDVAVMMNLLKVARIKSSPENLDNWEDGCGYLACGGELVGRKK